MHRPPTRPRLRATLLLAVAAVNLLWPAAPASAQGLGSVDLLTEANVRIAGARTNDHAGLAVGGAGDFNGDGRADVIVGAFGADNNRLRESGSAYVIFGQPELSSVELALLGAGQGLRIDGAVEGEGAGISVAPAGDVNGDGRADVIVGASAAGHNGRRESGSAYVVFGRAAGGNLRLSALGSGGFRIDGAAEGDAAGGAVAGVGDLNGDNRSDVVVGSQFASNNNRVDSGSAHVVLGRTASSPVDLAALPAGAGFRIDGAAAEDRAGASVAGTGDVNGDGRADLMVGAPGADANERAVSGSAHVVFGSASPARVDLASPGQGGYRIDGAAAADTAGASVAGVGDLNGDNRGDLLVGSPGADGAGRLDAGAAHVVFGRDAGGAVDLGAPGGGGFRIDGAGAGDLTGLSVAGIPNLVGDERPDLLIGAPQADENLREGSGTAYVLPGRGSGPTVDLRAIERIGGFRIEGPAEVSALGVVASAGDFNGDSRPDVLAGADIADGGAPLSGAAFVVTQQRVLQPGPCANLRSGTSRSDSLLGSDAGDRIAGGDGNDRIGGRRGVDCLLGESGADRLFGDPGDDSITGDSGNDGLAGGAGADNLQGGSGADRMSGDAGGDRVFGGSGDDVLKGGSGNDVVSGAAGRNRIDAGSGSDTIYAANRRREVVRCGRGRDNVRADRADRLIACERARRVAEPRRRPRPRRPPRGR